MFYCVICVLGVGLECNFSPFVETEIFDPIAVNGFLSSIELLFLVNLGAFRLETKSGSKSGGKYLLRTVL